MSRSTALSLVALLAVGAATPALAKEKGRVSPAAAGEEKLPPGEIRVRAESYEQVAKGHLQARGLVDLRIGDMRIQADQADVFEQTLADGSVSRRFEGEGNVVFIRGEERLAGDRMEMDDTGRGVFLNAVGYVEPGVFVEARRVERLNDKTYRVEGGRFTSCSQPNPRWKFLSSSATIHVDDKITAHNAVFEVKGVPAFYVPYIYYPIRKDGRSTGLLTPRFGYDHYRGFELGAGFFWAMGRSADQTFFVDRYSRVGFGFGHELRWTGRSPSRGTLRTYLLDNRNADALDYDIDWNALQTFPGKVRATLNVRKYSNLLFQQQFQDNFDLATTRTQSWSGGLERDFAFGVLSASAETTDTYSGKTYRYVQGSVPTVELRRFPRAIGWAGLVFGLTAKGERIRNGNLERVNTWSRSAFEPTVSRPFRASFLEFSPSATYHYVRYGSSLTVNEAGEAVLDGPPVSRSFFETNLEVRGPTLSRVFDAPGLGYAGRFKHTIGPEVTWTYVSRVQHYNDIPLSPRGNDYQLGTDEIRYALVQRFYSKRRGPTGKPQTYEFFSWRLMQTYYRQIGQSARGDNDPNYSSSAFGPGQVPEHLSPLMSRMRLRPSPEYSLDYQLEYDVNFKQVRRMSAFANVARPGLAFSAGWSRMWRFVSGEERVLSAETLRGSTVVDVLPKRLTLEGSIDYDVLNNIMYQTRAQARYSVQCCGFTAEYIRFNWNDRILPKWHFSVELANVGSVGTPMGADATGRRQGLGGYR